jgi:hypothetical protein
MAAGFAVNIAPRALTDVASVAQWWRKNRLGAPRLFQQELDAALSAIAERPEIGRHRDHDTGTAPGRDAAVIQREEDASGSGSRSGHRAGQNGVATARCSATSLPRSFDW